MKQIPKLFIAAMIAAFLTVIAPRACAYYDPGPQRWINRDPAQETFDPNVYRPVINNPVSHFDADGRMSLAIPAIIVIGGGLLGLEEFQCANRIKNEVWDKYGWTRDQNGNWEPRPDHHAGDNKFHYGHCLASCRVQRECLTGSATSLITGIAKEVWDQIKHIFGSGPGWEGGDLDANREGRTRSRKCPEKSCEDACAGTEG